MPQSNAETSKWVVGLTGGIASGKSTVSEQLRALGVGVVDADGLSREVVARGTDGLKEVVTTFGPEVLRPDGTLDREKLGTIVFGDDEARAKLVAITHPRIGTLSMQRLSELQAGDAPYIAYEAALLIETGAHKGMVKMIVVAASPETQRDRVGTRDGLDPEAAQARIDAQLPLADKLAVADYVIENNGTLEQLRARTREVHAEIIAACSA